MRARIFVASLLVLPMIAHCAATSAVEQRSDGRLAPPSAVKCPANNLTVYSGKATSWRQFGDRAEITISTDWATIEKVTIPGSGQNQQKTYLVRGNQFQLDHRKQIFVADDALQPNVRVNAWVCSDKAVPPVLDWQPPR